MELFKDTNAKSDDLWLVKEFFNSTYRHGRFIRVVGKLAKKESVVINEEYCLFPEPEAGEPELTFSGVKFGNPCGELIISEEACGRFIDEACERFLLAQPRESARIREVLDSRLI